VERSIVEAISPAREILDFEAGIHIAVLPAVTMFFGFFIVSEPRRNNELIINILWYLLRLL
jgi:hypothetical protein